MERCSTSLIIREMQIKTIMRYHPTSVRMVIIKSLQTVNAGEGVEKRKCACTVGGNVNWYSPMEDGRRRQWHLTQVFLPGKSHRRRSLEGCSPWAFWGLDTTEKLHFHFSLSCIGEGNNNPLQCSCLENPRVRGAWWAAVYGVAQSRTQLKWLSSSSMENSIEFHKKKKN